MDPGLLLPRRHGRGQHDGVTRGRDNVRVRVARLDQRLDRGRQGGCYTPTVQSPVHCSMYVAENYILVPVSRCLTMGTMFMFL